MNCTTPPLSRRQRSREEGITVAPTIHVRPAAADAFPGSTPTSISTAHQARTSRLAHTRLPEPRGNHQPPNVGVPSHPVFETSSMTPSGPVHFTSTLPSVPGTTPSACSTS